MNKVIEKLLVGKSENYLMPFFWLHGEDEHVLRDYMKAINESGCGAVCVESRPHPDFCGEKWWRDMDIILDEARKRKMKVWILDDAHFPTGYANGVLVGADSSLCRQSICASKNDEPFPLPFVQSRVEQILLDGEYRQFDDDRIISTVQCGNTKWKVGLSRNFGPHRNYINMMSAKSVRLLIDEVYEKHWQHYSEDFGETIAGFFSDEPELGNGHLYDMECYLGTDNDFPFAEELEDELLVTLGENWADKMYLLWENDGEQAEMKRVRLAYMDAVTRLVRDNFSYQIGDWCREHGVEYIGHLIEDSGAHTRTASSLGHFFRGLEGQDMAGIDDIGGQVYPQGENDYSVGALDQKRDGDFFHFTLGKLASSAAHIEKQKKGRAMCEIFGNYGWSEGVQLEKYLADHFMVRGVNYFVPHAFSAKAFPDPDCPPHFYAHGHNPQYRHFGELCRYMNRVCTLISSGKHNVKVAVLYHAEAEWSGQNITCDKVCRTLEENQISFDIVPLDYFAFPEKYHQIDYELLVIPRSDLYEELKAFGVETIYYDETTTYIEKADLQEVEIFPPSEYLRILHTGGAYFFVNESARAYNGYVKFKENSACYVYDAYFNKVESIPAVIKEEKTQIEISLEPRKSLFVIFGEIPQTLTDMDNVVITDLARNLVKLTNIRRSVCESIEYPNFGTEETIERFDSVEKTLPEFSGFVSYKADFMANEKERFVLEIEDAAEGVEVFVNGNSAGIQIVPCYIYDISKFIKQGKNELRIEVATTLERKCYLLLEPSQQKATAQPIAKSGITGDVKLFRLDLN